MSGISFADVARQRLLRGVLRTGDTWCTEAELAALGGRGHVGVGALRAVREAGHLRVVWRGSLVEPHITWSGLRWLVHEYPHSIDGGPASEWTGTTLVTLGDTTAELSDWCQALGVDRQRVVRDLRAGWTLLQALAQVGPSDCTRTGLTVDEEVAAFRARHPHGATLAEVGAWFGVTRERIRQIQESAFRRIRDRADPELAEDFFAHLADRVSWDDVHCGP